MLFKKLTNFSNSIYQLCSLKLLNSRYFLRDIKTTKTEKIKPQPLPLYSFTTFAIHKLRRRVADLFYNQTKGYKNDKAKEAQALKSCSWPASFPCLRGAPNDREA